MEHSRHDPLAKLRVYQHSLSLMAEIDVHKGDLAYELDIVVQFWNRCSQNIWKSSFWQVRNCFAIKNHQPGLDMRLLGFCVTEWDVCVTECISSGSTWWSGLSINSSRYTRTPSVTASRLEKCQAPCKCFCVTLDNFAFPSFEEMALITRLHQ